MTTIKSYSFTSDSGVKGKIKVFWETGAFEITAERLPFISGFLGRSVGEYVCTFVRGRLALNLTLEGYGGLILHHKRTDYGIAQYLENFYAKTPDHTTYLTMPNRLLKLDYESYQNNWNMSYQPGNIAFILEENVEILKGKEVERPW
ncbi:MAG: hypothetical protein ACQEXV_22555 [Bacillota bacterium]